MFMDENFVSTSDAISSPESVDGHSLLTLPDGHEAGLFGPVPVLASRSALRAKGKVKRMKDTSGRCSYGSSETASLQLSLASRLHLMLDIDGSPEYAMTWKRRAMQSGPPICQLVASGRRIGDSDFFGVPTPTVINVIENNDPRDRIIELKSGQLRKLSKNNREGTLNWSQWVLHKGYLPTPKLGLYWMGYPEGWHSCGVLAMQSFLK